jgi:Tol biopolymer transport system component
MGEVYRARDTRLDRTVAIKVLPSEVANNPERRARFEREARAVSSLNHPHICTLHDIGREGDTDYIVMEHLDGESLADRLAKGPLPLDQALRHAADIADALDKAHRHGIVHRDLKPGNVMLTKSGAKLLDFGLAKLDLPSPAGRGVGGEGVGGEGVSALATREKPLTGKGMLLGTYQYMAPEQLEGKDADARTDIFAFGSVLYEMVTGKRAFEGTSQASLIGAILKDEPQPISTLQPMTPPALDRLVRKCLAKDPDGRWQSAGDLADELKWIAGPSAAGMAAPVAPGSKRRAEPLFAWALAAGATLTAVGAMLHVRTGAAPTAPRMILSILPPPGGAWTDWFALSPDGRRLALVGSNEGRMQIWIRRLDEEDAHPVAGTDGAENPFWSPDSRALGFFSQGKLKQVDLESGAVQVLCDAGLGRGGAWSREGVILFTGTAPGLSRVSAAGGAPVAATRLEAARGDSIHRWPQFLPDGKRFIVFVWTGNPDTTGIYLGTPGSQELNLLQPSREAGQFMPPDRLLFARGEALIAQRIDLDQAQPVGESETLVRQVDVAELPAFLRLFSVSHNGIVAYRDAGGQRPLVWFDRRGQVVGRTSAVAGSPGLSLSPDESLAAYSTGTLSASDVWILDLKRDVSTKLTSGPVANNPLFSRDGRFVYYRFSGSQHFEIRRRPVRGGGPEETVFGGGAAFDSPYDETPDGKTLIVQNSKRSFDLWTLLLGGDRKLTPLVATEASERGARLSPDGHWFAYSSDESARLEVYVRRFPVTEEKWQISPRGGIWPYWRGDGKEIYYVGLDGALMAAPVFAGQAFSVGVPESLFQTRLRVWGLAPQYVASRDGQRFLMVYPTQDPAASPLHVLLNWHPSVKPR